MKRKFTPGTPGAFESVTADVYRAAPGLSKSQLALFRECPAKFKAAMDGKIQPRSTDAMSYGTILHAAILENDFDYYVRPETRSDGGKWTRASKECQEWHSLHSDREVLSPADDAEVRLVARTVRKHPLAWPLLKGSRREVSLFAEYGGRLMKGRADAVNDGWICDVKKVADASNHALSRAIFQYGHHIQAALYWKLAVLNGIACDGFYFIAIELGDTTGDQCLLNVRKLSHAAMELGLVELDKMLSELSVCEKFGVWPDYSGVSVEEIDLPSYAYGDVELVGADEVGEPQHSTT